MLKIIRWIKSLLKKDKNAKKKNVFFNDCFIADDIYPIYGYRKTPSVSTFRNIRPGHIVDAMMPLSGDAVAKVPEDHRHRPYIIAEKHDDYVIAYSGSSRKRDTYIDYFFLSKSKYKVWKDGYISLYRPHKLPADKLLEIKDSLTLNDVIEINKIINRIPTNDFHPRINVKIKFPVGSIVQRGQKKYYVCWINDKQAGLFKLLDTPTPVAICFQGKTYYLKPSNLKVVDYTNMFVPIGYIGSDAAKNLFKLRKSRPN